MREIKTKTLAAVLVVALLMTPFSSQAVVAVATGAERYAKDGLPLLQENEQMKVFVCHAKNDAMKSREAERCALAKCLRHFKIPLTEISTQNEKGLVGEKCKGDGVTNVRGSHNMAAVGDKGDNRFMYSKIIGAVSREEMMADLKSNSFPLKKENIVFDILDTGNNGKETLASAFPEEKGKRGPSNPERPGKPRIAR